VVHEIKKCFKCIFNDLHDGQILHHAYNPFTLFRYCNKIQLDGKAAEGRCGASLQSCNSLARTLHCTSEYVRHYFNIGEIHVCITVQFENGENLFSKGMRSRKLLHKPMQMRPAERWITEKLVNPQLRVFFVLSNNK
jgi:hypothetical protein